MKKLIFLALVFAAFSATGFSQSKLATTATSTVFLDTSTNSTQIYMYSALIAAKRVTSVKLVGTRLSGSIKGSLALQYATDTTGFAAGTLTWITHNDSVSFTNAATVTKTWSALGFARFIRIRVTTIDSTQSLQSAGLYLSK